jgi:hypothetical protein
MKTIFLSIVLSLGLVQAHYGQKVDTLTNEKIIKLSKMGLQPSVLINKIQTSYTFFDVSTDGLISLSENGVHADVISEMMNVDHAAATVKANTRDMNDPLTHRSTGIYYYDPANKDKPIRRLDPTISSSLKSGGFGSALAQAYTYGIANDQLKSSLAGSNSRLQIEDSSPVFYFYFDNNNNPNSDNWFFATATSPNEFILLKLTQKKDSREVVIGTANSYGSKSGINNKANQDFTYEELGEGIFKVTLSKPLKTGEYCFQYASLTPSRFDNNKVFDFGINVEEERNKKQK